MAKNVKDAEEKLGKDKVQEIIEKEWKIVDLPSEEEIKSQESKSPKARNNINSRKNLIQYNKKTKEQKEKMVSNLKYVEVEEDVNPSDILGKFSDIAAIEQLMPALDVLADRKEQEIYYNYLSLMLKDFDVEELTASDFDDILTLALNRVIEYRLLKVGAKSAKLILEAAPTIEKYRKISERIKSGLASRRIDRIDVKNKPAFSIVDLAAEIEAQEKADYEERLRKLDEEQADYVAPARNAEGFLTEDES